MAFVGAIVQAVKGGVEKISNESKISDLEKEIEKDLFEDFSEEEKLIAQIKLKQAEIELAVIKGNNHRYISSMEKELTALMEQNIKLKMEKLKQKEATQLDIANTMIAIQKTNNDFKDNLAKIEKALHTKYSAQSSKLNKISQEVNNINGLVISTQKQIQKQIQKEIRVQRNELYQLNNALTEISERVELNETILIELTETAKVQRWLNRTMLLLSIIYCWFKLWFN